MGDNRSHHCAVNSIKRGVLLTPAIRIIKDDSACEKFVIHSRKPIEEGDDRFGSDWSFAFSSCWGACWVLTRNRSSTLSQRPEKHHLVTAH